MRTLLAGLAALVAFASLAAAQPTYSKEVSRIFRAKCEQCHREGDIAPFALKDYDAAAAWSERTCSERVWSSWACSAPACCQRESKRTTLGTLTRGSMLTGW